MAVTRAQIEAAYRDATEKREKWDRISDILRRQREEIERLLIQARQLELALPELEFEEKEAFNICDAAEEEYAKLARVWYGEQDGEEV